MSIPSSRRARVLTLAAGLTVGAGLLSACSSSGGSGADTSPAAATASASTSSSSSSAGVLAAAGCPSTIKIQTSWYPEAEKGALYQIVGASGKGDTNHGSFSGTVGGVTVSVLAGGPYLGNQSTVAKMYSDSSVLLGEVSTDDAIEVSNKTPVVGVVAVLQKSPKALIYDPKHYSFTSAADVGKSGATVLKAGEDASTDLLVASGALKKGQLDYSYDGSPGRFVTANGKDVLVDYATEAPYSYEHLKQWGKPLDSLLLADGGYTTYENALSVTPQNETKYSACLKAFVPMVQKAIVDYAADPTPVNAAMQSYAEKAKSPTTLTPASTAYADKVMTEKGIVANGTDGTVGSFDTTRVAALITSMGPVAKSQNITLKSGLGAAQVVTNQFLDTSLKIAG